MQLLAEAHDLYPGEGDRCHGSGGEDQPKGRSQPGLGTAGHGDRCSHRADAHRTGQLREEPPTSAADVEPELEQDERCGHRYGHQPTRAGQGQGGGGEHGEERQLTGRDLGGEAGPFEHAPATSIDHRQLQGRADQEGDDRCHRDGGTGPRRGHQKTQETGLGRQTPATVLGWEGDRLPRSPLPARCVGGTAPTHLVPRVMAPVDPAAGDRHGLVDGGIGAASDRRRSGVLVCGVGIVAGQAPRARR